MGVYPTISNIGLRVVLKPLKRIMESVVLAKLAGLHLRRLNIIDKIVRMTHSLRTAIGLAVLAA
jgi:hypothetical protein